MLDANVLSFASVMFDHNEDTPFADMHAKLKPFDEVFVSKQKLEEFLTLRSYTVLILLEEFVEWLRSRSKSLSGAHDIAETLTNGVRFLTVCLDDTAVLDGKQPDSAKWVLYADAYV